MPQLSYAYAAGKISVLETHLLKKDKYDRLLDAENIDEVEKILSETAYGPRISEAGFPGDCNSAGKARSLLFFGENDTAKGNF